VVVVSVAGMGWLGPPFPPLSWYPTVAKSVHGRNRNVDVRCVIEDSKKNVSATGTSRGVCAPEAGPIIGIPVAPEDVPDGADAESDAKLCLP
jgi:hypothetical protein